jgi:hypothetical protein
MSALDPPPIPTVSTPSVTPPLVPVTTPPAVEPMTAPQAPVAQQQPDKLLIPGYSRVLSVSLHPATMQWLAPIGLTLALIFSFFKWTGAYPAGYPAYTQSAWQALFGTMSTDPVAEKGLKAESAIREHLQPSWWLLPYVSLLILAVVIVWAHHLASRGRIRLPAVLQGFWGIRLAILAALGGILLLLILIQTSVGFGVELSILEKVNQAHADEIKEAKTPEEIQLVKMELSAKTAGFQVGQTVWLWLTILLHVLVLLGIASEMAIQQRPDKPPPRIGVFW